MALTTYAELQQAIIDFAMRDGDEDFEASVPDFITLCETLLNHGADSIPPLRVSDMETLATATLDEGQVALPTDYLEFREVWTEDTNPRSLTYGAPSELRLRYGDTAGYPARFTIMGNRLRVYPTSDATTIGLTYYAKIPALSDVVTDNWLLLKAPNVYLYGSLLQAAPYMKDDSRIAVWGQLYQNSVQGLINSDRRGKYARAGVNVSGFTP